MPIYSEENNYNDLIQNRIRTLNIFEQDSEAYGTLCDFSGTLIGTTDNNPNRFRYFNDYVSVGKRVLDKRISKEFLYNNGNISEFIKTYSYQYDNPLHYQLTKETNIYSDNTVSTTNYKYAHEKSNQKLINANIIGIPLETEVKQNSKTISKVETKYDNLSNLFPSSVLSYDNLNASPSTEVTYDQYDSKGNLQQYTTKSGIPVAIVWGYNGTQPIAKIEGTTYAQVQSLAAAIMTASDTDASAAPNNDEADLLNALKTFRAGLPNYQVTTYTYDPLIGVRSITPPSGVREVYLYDTANRLMEIREQSKTGKLLKEFKYNYKN